MARYDISGIVIDVPVSTENYIHYMNEMSSLCKNIGSDFNAWYTKQGNSVNVYENIEKIIDRLTMPIINKGIDLLKQDGVYSFDSKRFIDRYLGDEIDDFYYITEDMVNEIEEINAEKQDQKDYRKLRKDTRTKAVGYGYGIGGTIKAKAKALMPQPELHIL